MNKSHKISGNIIARAFHYLKHIGRDPFADWAAILFLGFIIAFILSSVSLYKYLGIGQDIFDPTPVRPKPASILDQTSLNKAVGQSESRAGERAEILKTYKAPAEPL